MTKTVAAQADQLKDTIAHRLAELADELLGRPVWGSEQWLAQTKHLQHDKQAAQAWQREWHLAKIQISREAKIDPTGDAINARSNGATWQNIADACGFSRQRAYDKWAHLV